jgi:hypothetical protein
VDDNSLSGSVEIEDEAARFDWTANRFRSLVGLCEEKLRHGETGVTLKVLVDEARRLAAETDAANYAMEEDEELALRFDAVVDAWKELRCS